MKRYHVIGIALLAGLIVGCAVPAHAKEKPLAVASLDGAWICGNTGVSVNITTVHQGYVEGGEIIHDSYIGIIDEGQKIIFSGAVGVTGDSDPTKYGVSYFGNNNQTRYDVKYLAPNAIQVTMYANSDPSVWDWVKTDRSYTCTE